MKIKIRYLGLWFGVSVVIISMQSCLTKYGPGLSIMGLILDQYDNAGPFPSPPSPTSRRRLLPRRRSDAAAGGGRRTPLPRHPHEGPRQIKIETFAAQPPDNKFESVWHGRSCPRPSGGFRLGRGRCPRRRRRRRGLVLAEVFDEAGDVVIAKVKFCRCYTVFSNSAGVI